MEHTFVICAYKESPYIEECINSLKQQTIASEIIMATSTPSEYLKNVCLKYSIPYYVREGEPGIAADWNYAYSLAASDYVTIAHQDDVYYADYVSNVMEQVRNTEKALIAFTDYSELRNGVQNRGGKNLIIKRLLLFPMKFKLGNGKKVWKRFVLRFGNAISCPTVTYHKKVLDEMLNSNQKKYLFRDHFRSNLDWETWEWLSCEEGTFVYVPKVLMSHRIHEESETSVTIQSNLRRTEDYEMFCKFWPKRVAKVITGVYSESERSNKV